jgi:hypothetical protein
MFTSSRRSPWLALVLSAALATPPGALLTAQSKPAVVSAQLTATPPPGTNADTGWPRIIEMKSGTAVWYQPQIESWVNQKNVVAWSAVSYLPTGAKQPTLGTIKIEGPARVALDDRVVTLDLKITEYNFTSLAPDQVKAFVADVQALPVNQRVLDLDRMLAYVDTSPLLPLNNSEALKADPPKVFYSRTPAVLLNLDGDPVWSPIQNVDLRYAVNTNWDLLEHTPSKTLYLRYNQSWLQATTVQGPWKPAAKLPESFSKLPADDNWKDVKAAVPGTPLLQSAMPKVFVSTEPAELILLDGQPRYVRVAGAPTLLWVNNTESDLFRMSITGDFYFLVAGRWFKSPSLEGPWTFATPSLPDDFKQISAEHPRSRVLASVPGTRQATEALLIASIPRTARVNRKELRAPDVVYQGEPQFQPIADTMGLERAANTDKDIIKVGDVYYMCFQAVWFMSRSANGPWEVATTVPEQIYTIPASSPSHHVTYVTIEDDDDDDDEWVTYAYLGAYTGMMVGWGCAVWGTGWYYPPYYYYGGFYPAYFPYPHTYGFGAWYNPYTGGFGRAGAIYGPYGGVGAAASYNPRTGTYARGVAAHGPYGSRAAGQAFNPRTGTYAQTRQGSNIYGNWGSSSVVRGDSWAQTAHVENYRRGTSTSGIRTDSGAGAISRTGADGSRTTVGRSQSGDIYAGRDGNIYQRNGAGDWEQVRAGGAQPRDRAAQTPSTGRDRAAQTPSTGVDRAGQLERDRNARVQGNQRTADRGSWQRSGGTRSGAGSFGGGGRARGGGGRRR